MDSSSLVMVLVTAVLTVLVATTSRAAAVENDVWVLTYSPVWRGFVKLAWLFPVVIAVVCVFSPPKAGERWIPFAIIIGFSALNLPLSLEVFKRRIELAENKITQYSAWSDPVTIAWLDVREVVWKLSNELHVRSKRGVLVRISMHLSGMDTLADEFETRLPHVPGIEKIAARLRAKHI